MEKRNLEEFIPYTDTLRLLQRFFSHLGCSAGIFDENGKLKVFDYITPFCKLIYSKVPERCEADRRLRFRKALKLRKPFLHRCFAGKLNFVIPLIYKDNKNVYFLGVAGG